MFFCFAKIRRSGIGQKSLVLVLLLSHSSFDEFKIVPVK
jgi:hypothetical protein